MNTTAIGTELEGRIVDGRFTLLRWLGGSPESGVYLTKVDGDETGQAAIKLVAAEAPDAEIRLTGWVTAANLAHPHLIRVLYTGRCAIDDREVVYAVTELADEVLAEILRERPLTPEETGEMLRPVLEALAYLRGQGLVHGRLKPSNILVVEDQLKLSADCVSLEDRPAANVRTEPGVYDAPELGRGEISAAADIWSLGMTLVRTLTQHAPAWESADGGELAVPASIPEPFAGIVRECLRLDPAQRCTLSEIKARLEPETAQQPEPVPPAEIAPPPAVAPPQETARLIETNMPETPPRFRGRHAVLITGAVLLVGIGAAVLIHSRQTPPPPASIVEQSPAPEASAAPPTPSEAAPAPPSLPKPAPEAPATPQAPPPASAAQGATNGAVVKRVLPDVPAKAQQTIHGKVVVNVQVTVDANGDVSDAVSDPPGTSKYFTRLAVEAAREWKFTPGASAWTLRFVFRNDGTDATAAETP